jgi:Succinylglutamate desuccinylase / Aspartoacylase family
MEIATSFDYAQFSSQLSTLGGSTNIGFSAMHREIRAWRTGSAQQRPTLIVAGQHGDETCAMLAAAKLIRIYNEDLNEVQPAAWIIPCVNPDATIENKRQNSQGLDLNRDHLARLSPEVQSLHRFIQRIEPSCVLDLHCFPTRRRWMKELNIEHSADLLIDWATGPAALMVNEPCPVGMSRIREWLQEMGSMPFVVSRYWLRSGRGRLRHSTPDWLDLRNQVAACYRIPTYLIEGREPLPHEIGQHDRTTESMVLAVTGILDAYRSRILSRSDGLSTSSPPITGLMPTRFEYQSREVIQTHLRDRIHHRAYVNTVGKKHSDVTQPSRYVRVAERLWIPKSLNGLINHLQRLQAPLHDGTDQSHEISNADFELLQFQVSGGRSSRKVLRNGREMQITQALGLLSDRQAFVVLSPSLEDQVYWNALLDPRHKFSICRMHRQELCRPSDDRYPILFQYRRSHSN